MEQSQFRCQAASTSTAHHTHAIRQNIKPYHTKHQQPWRDHQPGVPPRLLSPQRVVVVAKCLPRKVSRPRCRNKKEGRRRRRKLIGISTIRDVPLMGVQNMLRMELECASSMGQSINDAARKDAQIKLSAEECANGMGQKPHYAARKDAQIKLSAEEYAKSMGQRSRPKYAATKDAQCLLRRGSRPRCRNKKEGQRRRKNMIGVSTRRDVPLMGARSSLSVEECASRMGQKSHRNDAAQKVARIRYREKDCA